MDTDGQRTARDEFGPELEQLATKFLTEIDALKKRMAETPVGEPPPTVTDFPTLFEKYGKDGFIDFRASLPPVGLMKDLRQLNIDPSGAAKLLQAPPKILLKVVSKEGNAIHGGKGTWPMPKDDKPGDWLEVDGKLLACSTGLHLTDLRNLHLWTRAGSRLFLAEVEGPVIDADNKFVVRRARLVREIPTNMDGGLDVQWLTEAEKTAAEAKAVAAITSSKAYANHGWTATTIAALQDEIAATKRELARQYHEMMAAAYAQDDETERRTEIKAAGKVNDATRELDHVEFPNKLSTLAEAAKMRGLKKESDLPAAQALVAEVYARALGVDAADVEGATPRVYFDDWGKIFYLG